MRRPRSGLFCLVRTLALALPIATLSFAAGGQVKAAAPAKGTFSVVYKFRGPPDAAFPWAGLVRGADGGLYGTTWAGGRPANCNGGLGVGCGTLFRLDSSGNEKVIWNFNGTPGPIHPRGSLLPERDGSFYGLTEEGGSVSVCYKGNAHGCGTAFKLRADGSLAILYNFGSQGGYSDAVLPEGALVRCGSGLFCATTRSGGTDENGTLFAISKTGKEKILYRFTGGTDGSHPGAYLVGDEAGNLYGVAGDGGGACNCGTVFRLAPDGSYSVLYTFQGASDGGNPYAGLVRDDAGNLFGIAVADGDLNCGNGYGCGVVFKLAPDGAETVLHAFSGPPDGLWPTAPLALDAHGNLYGSTWLGGDASCDSGYGCGAIFEITAQGEARVLHRFQGKDGIWPQARIFIDTNGDLIGSTQVGGRFDICSSGCGAMYKIRSTPRLN